MTIHANSKRFSIWLNGKEHAISHRTLALFLKKNGVTGDIRLVSCNAGAGDLAQNIANKMNVTVLAATSKVGVPLDGRGPLVLYGDGVWDFFKPVKFPKSRVR